MVQKIAHFVDISRRIADGRQHLLSFKTVPGVESGLSTVHFCIIGSDLIYTPQVKSLDAYLHAYLRGELSIGLDERGVELMRQGMSINFRQLMWDSLKRLSELDAYQLLSDAKSFTVRRSELASQRFSGGVQDRSEKSDNVVLCYFYSRPKPVSKFFEDYPATTQIAFYRGLLCLTMLDYLQFDLSVAAPVSVQGHADAALPEPQPTGVAKPATASVSTRLGGLRRILNAIKTI